MVINIKQKLNSKSILKILLKYITWVNVISYFPPLPDQNVATN